MSPTEAIRCENLTRTFGPLTAVDHINLKIPRAQIYGFLGPNGSGKSTTIRMLCGLIRPSEGSARVLDYNIPGQEEALKFKIGYMTQRFSLYEDLSVGENLDFMAKVYSLSGAQRRARIAEALAVFDLGDRQKQRAGTLSGGQKQRLSLAGTTLHQPELLFLDEPTSAVDPQSRRDFWEYLFQLCAQGTTILVSTHYMDEAERCHALAILDHGVVVADGSPRALEERIGVHVTEVESADLNQTHQSLTLTDGVLSVTQLGMRLRVLLRKDIADPIAHLSAATSGAADVKIARASLEDVFVAATRGHYRKGAA